jgi:hypothetical protein
MSFLGALHPAVRPSEYIELRWKDPAEGGSMRRTFVSTVEHAAERAVSLGNTYDVYVGVAPRRGEDGTRAGVCRIPAIRADLDAKDDHTRKSRLEQLMALPYHPSILVWTGGGWHAYWLLVKAAESPEEMERAELVMRRLTAGLDSDPVHDRSRILRVAGTFNHKYGEPRLVALELYEPNRRYEFAQLHKMAESLQSAVGGHGANSDGKVPREVLGEPIREFGRNLSLTSVAGSLRDRGLDTETTCVVLLEVNRVRCVPPLDEEEVRRIAQSIGRIAVGKPRYRRSTVRRIYNKRKES